MERIITAGLIGLVAYGVAGMVGLVSFAPIDALIALFKLIVGI